MARYKAILAYDGSAFSGFQRQAGARTVQGDVESALRGIGWRARTIYAAGRTDSGVHAAGQVIAFDLEWQHGLADLQNALNAHLPPDVAVRAVEEAAAEFHPRYAAASRRYAYRIFFDPVRDPLRERYAWRLWPAPDSGLLPRLAVQLVGTHDFAAFGTPPKTGGSTQRTVIDAGWAFPQGEAVFTIEANAFLFRMVRRIVQAQIETAQGRLSEADFAGYLSGGEMVQGLAPAQGLTLESVRFGRESDDGAAGAAAAEI